MPLAALGSTASAAPEVRNCRLILSDSFASQGQRVKTINYKPTAIVQLVGLLNEHFGFTELCRSHGVDPGTITTGTGGIHLVGLDGVRHVQIHSDDQLIAFWNGVKNTRLPSLEVQLGQPSAVHPVHREVVRNKPREAKDRIEDLEDLNFKMSKATQKVERGLEELERLRNADREETQRLVNFAKKELKESQDSAVRALQADIAKLVKVDTGLRKDIEDLRQKLGQLSKLGNERHEEVSQTLDDLNTRMQSQFEDVIGELTKLKEVDADQEAEDKAMMTQIQAHAAELVRLEEIKLDAKTWQDREFEREMQEKQEKVNLEAKFATMDREIRDSMARQRVDLEKADQDIRISLQDQCDRIDGEIRRIDHQVESNNTECKDKLTAAQAELVIKIDSDVSSLSQSTEARFAATTKDVVTKDTNVNRRVDELTAKNEATFVALNERLNELVKAERARLGTIEKDMSEGFAKMRSDYRADVERLRSDYEQEASRLDGDLTDLHMKHDVVKQEINFFQSRLMEQRDWAQRQLAETATATRAAQVDAQEGVAATTKMLHALRDDQIGFRDKMAKHVSLLQHASDSYGDAINTLETQRSRMRLELDALLGDHKAYVGDMDGWADDVRVKIERLFRAMEPPRCEWRISRAGTRLKEMKRPLAVKSPSFALQGLREVQLELYPHGHNNSPEGKAVLRILMPAGALVRYQTWLGRISDGSREYQSGGSLTVDILYDSWKDQVQEDGSLTVTMEVLQDLNNTDDSLARAVHLEQ